MRHRGPERSLGLAAPDWGVWQGRAARRDQEGVGVAAGSLDCQASSKPVPRKKKTVSAAGGGPGEPCRCDKLKISAAAHGDAPRAALPRGVCLAAGCRCRHRVWHSSGTSSGLAGAAQPLPSPRHTRPAVAPLSSSVSLPALFLLHPLISSSRLAAPSLPEILQFLGALAQLWLPHGKETKASGTGSPAAASPAAIPGQAARPWGDR